MPLCLQRILGWFDREVSNFLWITSMGDGDRKGTSSWCFFSCFGPRVAIVGVDGRIHTLTGRYTINHKYRNGKLVRRIPARKDLEPGERLATGAEIVQYQRELSERFSHAHGFIFS
jgi:hypothetical protein